MHVPGVRVKRCLKREDDRDKSARGGPMSDEAMIT